MSRTTSHGVPLPVLFAALAITLSLLFVGGAVAARSGSGPRSTAQGRTESVSPVDAVVARPVPLSGRGREVPVPDPDWVDRTAGATGIPATALRAYAGAALALDRTDRACHLGWTTLAGIGWIESQHGSIGGRELLDDGRPSTPVVGPALDGSAYALVTDGGYVAHALGPLQFLPSTWRTWAADGDRDGTADVQDIDDAALAAGRYLCAGGRDLAAAAGWTAAILSYNHASAYLWAVHDAAVTYDARGRSHGR